MLTSLITRHAKNAALPLNLTAKLPFVEIEVSSNIISGLHTNSPACKQILFPPMPIWERNPKGNVARWAGINTDIPKLQLGLF